MKRVKPSLKEGKEVRTFKRFRHETSCRKSEKRKFIKQNKGKKTSMICSATLNKNLCDIFFGSYRRKPIVFFCLNQSLFIDDHTTCAGKNQNTHLKSASRICPRMMVVIAGMIGVIRTHEFRRYSRCSNNSATSAELYTFNSVFLFSSINASL